MQAIVLIFAALSPGFWTEADAENAYGDHGIVFTAIAAQVDENYQNIVSVPSTPMEIDNKMEKYPGFNFGFVFRRPLSCDVDYSRNELYVFDFYLRGLLLLENFNSSAIKDEITITQQHYGVSQERVQIAVDWISHNVYWTEPLMNWIAMQPGGAINDIHRYKIVLRNLNLPRGLAVDPIAGYLFWSDIGTTSVIQRSSLIGENKKTLVHSQLNVPNAIVADPSEKRIYWIDTQFIDSISYEGTERKSIVRGNDVSYFDIALFKDVLITTDLYSFYNGSRTFYARFYDKTSGKELTDKRIGVSREIFYGTCMYHGDNQPAKPEQDRCKAAGCQHICVNEPTKATCLCSEGFVLKADGKSCEEKGGQHQRALVISTGSSLCLLDIRVLSDKHDFKPTCFYNGTEVDNITIFDINMDTREVYFAIGSTINVVKVDRGSDGQYRDKDVIDNQSYNITGMSYDYASGRLYYAIASNPVQLWYIDVYTKSPVFKLNVDHGDLRSLTVVPSQEKVYWLAGANLLQTLDISSDNNNNVENLTLVYHPVWGVVYPKRMVHYNKREELYVLIEGINGHSDLLAIDYQGNSTDYLPTVDNMTDFAIYKEYIVLITHKDGKHIVRSADLGLGYPLQTVDEGTVTGLDEIYAVRILDAGLQEKIQNPCNASSNNGGCEHICIPEGDKATCKCKLGFTLHPDGQQCISLPVYDDFILVTDLTYNEILQIPLNNPTNVVGIRTPATDRPDGVMYNYQTKEMVWTSTSAAMIWAVYLNGTRQRVLTDVDGTSAGLTIEQRKNGWSTCVLTASDNDLYLDSDFFFPSNGHVYSYCTVAPVDSKTYVITLDALIGYPDQLALDPSTGNIYYTTVSYYSDVLYDSMISVINKQGQQTIVIWDGHKPRDIEVDPAEGLMFWTDYSVAVPALFRANMDGSEQETLHAENVTWPNGIALDYLAKRIYWTDGYLDRIYYSDYDGNNREVFMEVESGTRLMDLELVGDYLYYTSMSSQQVIAVNKNNKNDIKKFGPEAGLGRLYGLDVYSSSAQTNTPVNTGCASNNGGCSHFCLPKVGGHTCGCTLYVDLLPDGKTCEDAPRCQMSIPNGEIIEDPSCVGVEGNVCSYKCNLGYKPRASVPKITCSSVSSLLNWDVQDPCEPIMCRDYVENGVVAGNCSLLPGDVCLYGCSDGFDPNPNMTHIMCGANGEWNNKANDTVLCTLKTTTMKTTTAGKEPEKSASTGKNVGIGVGVGIGVVVLIVIIVIVIIFLIRTGKISSPSGKAATSTSFENPRYAGNDVQLGPTEANTSFGYTTLEEDKVAASATNRTYDNIVPRV